MTGISEIREKKGKDALKGSALYHMFKLGNPFIYLGKLKMEKQGQIDTVFRLQTISWKKFKLIQMNSTENKTIFQDNQVEQNCRVRLIGMGGKSFYQV